MPHTYNYTKIKIDQKQLHVQGNFSYNHLEHNAIGTKGMTIHIILSEGLLCVSLKVQLAHYVTTTLVVLVWNLFSFLQFLD